MNLGGSRVSLELLNNLVSGILFASQGESNGFLVAFRFRGTIVFRMTQPARIQSKDLVVGGCYLHRNGLFVRHIDAIEGNTVEYHDQYGSGFCSKQAFLRACQSVASKEDQARAEVDQKAIHGAQANDFTLRDEANALTAYAFRNGILEDLHAGKSSPILEQPGFSRITDDEMRRLMIESSEKLAGLLAMKLQESVKYEKFIRDYQRVYCRNWKRD